MSTEDPMSDQPTEQQIQEASAKGEQLYDLVTAAATGWEIEAEGELPSGTMLFSLWLSLTHHLAHLGWTEKQLVAAVRDRTKLGHAH
jgi:hypothetical protein